MNGLNDFYAKAELSDEYDAKQDRRKELEADAGGDPIGEIMDNYSALRNIVTLDIIKRAIQPMEQQVVTRAVDAMSDKIQEV